MPAGRTPYYSEYIQAAADWYADGGYKEREDIVPTVAGLACALGVSRETIYKWKGDHPSISDTVTRMMSEQERLLVTGGLGGIYEKTITKLMLHSSHRYSDRAETAHTNPDGSLSRPTRIEIVSATEADAAQDEEDTDEDEG